jgi:hypothetical protein
MNLKERYRKFRAWQRQPQRYTQRSSEKHHCPNCGQDFEGNYCPICGQIAGDGRISWGWVRQSILNLWAMGSRSMPYSILQLLLRPGYFIGEYISGHRQICYPPVNMLFGVAIIYAIVNQILGISFEPLPTKETNNESIKESINLLVTIINWLRGNPAWGTLTLTLLFILPTWVLFRFSPRHPRHTLPEGIFIQILMGSLILVCFLLSTLIPIAELFIPIYYYIAYRQLFGYSRWGTVWRLLLGFLVWSVASLLIGVMFLLPAIVDFVPWQFVLTIVILLLPIIIILVFGYWIGRRSEKKRLQRIEKQE